MRLMSGRGRHREQVPTVVKMRRVDHALYGMGFLGLCAVIACAEKLIETRGGAAALALVLLASGGIGQLARWLDGECKRHER